MNSWIGTALVLATVIRAAAVSPLDSGGSTPPAVTIVSPAANVVIVPGGTVNFQGSATDSDGTVSGYRWTFDGVASDSTAQNPGNVTFASPGAYHIYLMATDDKGVMNFASRWVFVSSTGSSAQPAALAAFHRSGQTFITWTENGSIAGESYRVYRHTSAINAGNLGSAQVVAQVAENSSLYSLESGGPIGQTRFIIQDKVDRDTEGLGTELAAGTGLFVYTVHNTSSNNYCYAVTTVNSAGQENRTDFSPGNSLAVTVGEVEAPPRAVHVYTDLFNNGVDYRGYAYTLFMDYDDWNPKYIGYAYNFGVSVPASYSPSGTNRYPVVLHVEGWGSRYTPADAVNDSSITIRGDDANQCWYYGFGANRNASTYRSGFVGNYQEKYLIEAVLTTMRDPYYRADTSRVYMFGHSMGGSGTLTIGTRYPGLFAATWSSQPMTDYEMSSRWLGDVTPKWGPTTGGGDPIINLPLSDPSLNGIARYNGTPVFDWQNTQLNMQKRVKDEMAYIQTGHNTDDTTIDWSTQGVPWYSILETSNTHKRAWSGYTGAGGHTWMGFQWNNKMMINNGAGHWLEWQFRNFEAMPGVAKCSRANARSLSWAASWYPQGHPATVDTSARFEMTLISGTGTFTADVTPRRRQRFLPAPGQLCAWTNVQSGASGTVTADANGLVTVTNFTITTTGNRLIITGMFEGRWREAPALAAPTGRVVYVGTALELRTALNAALSGDTIMLSNGTYALTNCYISGKDITIRGLSGDPSKVILQGRTWTDSSTFVDEDILRMRSCTNVTLAYLTIGECHAYGIKLGQDEGVILNPRFYNCRFINNGTRGIKSVYTAGRMIVGGRIEYCLFQNTKVPPASWNDGGNYITSIDCMQLSGWTISDSYFRDIKGRTGGGRGAVFIWNASANITIERCAFVGCDRSIAYGNPSTPTGGDPAVPHVAGGIIRNNMITVGGGSGIELSSVTGVKVLHNTIWTGEPVNGVVLNCPVYGVGVSGELRNNILRGRVIGGSLTQSGNVYGSAIVSTWFNDYAAADLRLASNVTNVTDKVTVLADGPTDWDGNFRPTGIGLADVGADEYGAGVYFDTTPPVVSGVSCSATTNSITVSWNTDEAANSIVRYGTINNWSTAAVTQETGTVTSHTLTITDLPSNTFYHVWIGAVDAAGNSRESEVPDGGAATVGGVSQVVTLQQGVNGYAGCADAQIWNNNLANVGNEASAQIGGPDTNHPLENEFRFLLDFDLNGYVPAGATVTSAMLSVRANGGGATTHHVGLHELSRSFVEGQVTWNDAASGQAWTLAGGDYGASIGVFATAGNSGWLTYDVKTVVQSWVNTPASRHGFTMVHQDDWIYLFLDTSEASTLTNRPKLTIGYASAPPVVKITSATHPDGTRGYASNVATMQWSVVNGVTADGYSWVFDRQPTTVPDTVSEGTGVSWTTNNLSSGAWYMHVRARSADGWGVAAHFVLNVGSDPDTDADGMSDASEAIAGTSPVDALDVLQFTSINLSGGSLRLTWPGKSQRMYYLQHTPSLSQAFTNVPGVQWTPGGNEDINHTLAPVDAKGFYRISVE